MSRRETTANQEKLRPWEAFAADLLELLALNPYCKVSESTASQRSDYNRLVEMVKYTHTNLKRTTNSIRLITSYKQTILKVL